MIREGMADIPDMLDHAVLRAAPYEVPRPINQFAQEQQCFRSEMETAELASEQSRIEQAWRASGLGNIASGSGQGLQTASGPGNIASGSGQDLGLRNEGDLIRIIHAPEGELPSDAVASPVMRSNGGASHMTYGILMLALMTVDIVACVSAFFSTALVIFGKAPERGRKACRLIINTRTRATCGKPPQDHGAVWNHVCTEHAHVGGRVSPFEYKSFMMVRWWHRVVVSITAVLRMTPRPVWKWNLFKYT